jgi:ribosomal-protein-alanine N-acetyltransferase
MSEVRELGPGDVEAFGDFIRRAWAEAGPGAPGWTGATDESVSRLASAEYVASLIGREDTRIFLVWDEGRVVGFSGNRRVDDETVELSGIVVLESATGRGVGSRLLESARDAALNDGYRRMLVRTEAFNERAIGFYEGKGFEEKGRSVADVEGVRVELVELELSLVDEKL